MDCSTESIGTVSQNGASRKSGAPSQTKESSVRPPEEKSKLRKQSDGPGQGGGRRNVTFSPPPSPPDLVFSEKKHKTPTRSPTNQKSLPSLHDAKLQSPCGGLFLSPYPSSPSAFGVIEESTKSSCPPSVADAKNGEGDSEESSTRQPTSRAPAVSVESNRERSVATPTNFAIDFGKGHQLSGSFDAANLFSPTAQGLFSPGGLGSALNTPRGMYGNLGGPRTPGTPTAIGTSFFFSDVASLPRNGEFSSPKPQASADGSKRGGTNLSNIIYISPLASTKRGAHRAAARRTPLQPKRRSGGSQSGTPMNYSDVFASPRIPISNGSATGVSTGRNTTLLGEVSNSKNAKSVNSRNKQRKNPNDDANLDVVHMAERDLMEDEDLSVLLQLASTATPRAGAASGKVASADTFPDGGSGGTQVFRSPRSQNAQNQFHGSARIETSRTAPASLQLPLISNHPSDVSPSKLKRKAAFRDLPQSHHNEFTPPPLAIRSSSSSGSKEIFLAPGPSGNDMDGENGSPTKGKSKSSSVFDTANITPENKTSKQLGQHARQATTNKRKKDSCHETIVRRGSGTISGAKMSKSGAGITGMGTSNSSVPPKSYPMQPASGQRHQDAQAPNSRAHPGTAPMSKQGGYGVPHPGGPQGSSMNFSRPHPHAMYAHHPPPLPPPHVGSLGAPPPYHGHYHSHHGHPHHHIPMYQGQHGNNPMTNAVPTAASKKEKKSKSPKSGRKGSNSGGSQQAKGGISGPKKPKKSSTKNGPKKQPKNGAMAAASAAASPVDRQKAAATIAAVNAASGGKNDRAAALAAAILRGVTMRPSGKWQAQLYYAGKSRYIGVFDTREKAALAYEIAREKLKSDNKSPADRSSQTLQDTEAAVNAARKAAFEGVNEKDPRVSSSK